MSAIAPGKLVQPADLELVKRIFQAVGEVVEVPESMLDAVTCKQYSVRRSYCKKRECTQQN
jgi:pyrroline-5-carboxylate reductase